MPFLGKTPSQIVDPEVDIDGGTIDGVSIGSVTANAGAFTNLTATGTLTLPDDGISGDDVNGGTISNFASTGIDDNATSTAITIDSSGDVLVGKASTAFGTAGVEASASNGLWSTRSSLPPLALNRLSTDGSIADFYKDATTFGSIGVDQTRPVFDGASAAGIRLGGSEIAPRKNGANSDGTVDLGWSGARFKDLYLANNITLTNATTSSFLQVSTNILQFGTSSSDPVAFYSNNAERMRIDGNGSLGIATTPPTVNIHPQMFIGDNFTIMGLSGSRGMNITTNAYYNSGWKYRENGYVQMYNHDNNGSHVWYNAASGTADAAVTLNEFMRIDSSGNVITGSSTANASDAVTLRQDGTAHVNNAQFSNGNGSVGGTTPSIYSPASATLAISTNSTERMRIDGSGNVAIGTSSTTNALFKTDIKGSSTGNFQALRLFNSSDGASATTDLSFCLNRVGSEVLGVAGSIKAGKEQTWTTTPSTVDGYLSFSTVLNETPAERMRITSSGHLLVGCTTDPSSSVKGMGYGNIAASGGDTSLVLSGGSYTGGDRQISFVNGNGTVGHITTSGSATAYGTTSDYRLKENVVSLDNATDRLKQIPVYRFNFIADPDTTVDGFLAHEVADFVPEAITGEKDGMRTEEYEVTPEVLDDDGNVIEEAVMATREVPEYQGIDQSKIVPLLTAALQEALTKIDDLETRLSALEAN